jgi:hypothetical protein
MATKKKTAKKNQEPVNNNLAVGDDLIPLRRQCGAMQAHFRLLETDDNFRTLQQELETSSNARLAQGMAAFRSVTVTIPVVVHVVYNTAAQNISATQIKSQIKVLNQDFRAKNSDKSGVPASWKSIIGDANIEFALAKKDPDGKPTNGITRTRTTRTSFGANDSVKKAAEGKTAWSRDSYLNLWVCSLGGGLLGYAQFPGGPAETDGVVINYKAFGTTGTAVAPFNRGRTATHEVGHWLNLRHIWGDTPDCSGTDSVNDTPNSAGPNFGLPSFPHISCGNGPHGDMFMNYMDYVDDAAMFMFTIEQVARMHSALDGARSSLGV